MSRIAATNVADLLRLTAGRRGSRTALVHGDRRVSWSEVDAEADAVAGGLLGGGHTEGDRIALVLGNVPEFVSSYLGVLRAGLVAVPLDPASAPGELRRRFTDAGVAVVIVQEASAPAVRDAVSAATSAAPAGPAEQRRPEVVVVAGAAAAGETTFATLLANGRDHALSGSETGAEDLALLLYTSGTSGRPQAVMLSHRALLTVVDQLLTLDPAPINGDDVVLGALPLSHVYGLAGVLGPVLATGATLVLTRFQADATLRLLREERVTSVPAAPQMLLAWAAAEELAQSFSTVRVLVSGGAPLPVAVSEEVETATGVPVHEGYGLTEAASAVTTSLASPKHKPGSVGRPLPGIELRVVDESGADVDTDPGEILIRAPNMFSGYWPDGSAAPGEDRWWRTGDVGYLDPDGDLFLVDRIKDLILVSGFNVYPREVEEVLEEHPGIAEAAVVGMPHPRTGETVKAFVVAEPGLRLDPAEIVAWSRERLARFKCPTIVSVVPELPYTAIGKVRRGELR